MLPRRTRRVVSASTQEELAELAHISVRAVSDIERGVNRRPYKSTVTSLADALGLDGEERAAFVGGVRRTVALMPPPEEQVDDVSEVNPAASSLTADPDRAEHPAAQAWKLRSSAALLAALALLLAVGGAFALYRISTATSVPGHITAGRSAERREIVRAVLQSDRVYRAARACACMASLSSVKVDPDLTRYRQQILDLRRHGERVRTTYHSLHVIAVTFETNSDGQALVSKDETAEIWRYGRMAEVCSGPYQVRYHVIHTPAGWRVDDTQLITGQACHSV